MPLRWLVNAYSSHSIHWGVDGPSHSIHKSKEARPQRTKGSFPRMQGDGFASKLDGIMEGAMWLSALLLVGL